MIKAGRDLLTPFALICVMGFLGRVSYEMIRSPISSLYAKHLGTPIEMIGLIVSAVTITGMLLKFPAGALADELGVRRVMGAGLVVKAVAPFLYLLVLNWVSLFGVRILHGGSSALFAPAAHAQVARLYPHQHGWRLGLYASLEHLGVVVGPPLAGLLLVWSGFPAVFVIAALVGFFALAIILAYPRDPVRERPQRAETIPRHLLGRITALLHEPAILLVCGVEAMLLGAQGTMQAYMPLYEHSIGIPVVQIGLLHSLEAVAAILTRPLVGTAGDRFGRMPFLLAGIALSASTLAAFPFVTDMYVLIALQMLFGVGAGLVTPSTVAMVADLVEHDEFGAAMGAFGSLSDVGHVFGPLLAGFLIAWFGYATGFGAVAALMVVAMAALLVGRRGFATSGRARLLAKEAGGAG